MKGPGGLRPGQNREGPAQNPGGGQGAQQPNIDPEDLPDIMCECGSKTFMDALRLKKMSALVSPTGEEGIAPMQTLVCTQCGKEYTGNKDNIDE